jgi:TrkA domain protein
VASVEEVDLAGIGKRYVVKTDAGERLIIVVHDSGAVELYQEPRANQGRSDCIATLNSEEARLVAAIIGRTIYRTESIERLSRHGLAVVWHGLTSQSSVVGKRLGDLNTARFPTLAIITVIEKGGTKGASPSPDYVFKEDSQIALAGTRREIQEFIELLEKDSK